MKTKILDLNNIPYDNGEKKIIIDVHTTGEILEFDYKT